MKIKEKYKKFLFLYSVLILIIILFSYCTLKKENIKTDVAMTMFGVYLIHEDSFVRPIIWSLISSKLYAHSGYEYLIAGLIFSLVVFVACILIDIVCRKLIFEKFINGLSGYISNLLNNLERIFEKI